jgi:hypothetical protein
MGKILRRCSLCGKYHASFLVSDFPGGKGHLCSSCWKAWQAAHSQSALPEIAPQGEILAHSAEAEGGEE